MLVSPFLNMMSHSSIEGVVVRDLVSHVDARGWLTELFRSDEIRPELAPVMAYVSASAPGVTRGPHEHRVQTDFFCFIGPSTFRVVCWDNRKHSRTHGQKMVLEVGERRPVALVVPPGIVHAYKNIGTTEGWVINLPNKLYAGEGRVDRVDEIRHEEDPNSKFHMDDE